MLSQAGLGSEGEHSRTTGFTSFHDTLSMIPHHIAKYFLWATAILLPLWWAIIGIVLPIDQAMEHFDLLLTHPAWVPINIIGLAGCLCWLLSLPAFLVLRDQSPVSIFANIFCRVGISGFIAIQYYETFLWPAVAQDFPELVQLDGALVIGDSRVLIPLVITGLITAVGYILWAIAHWKQSVFSRSLLLSTTFGAILFSVGGIVPLRTMGLIVFSITLVIIPRKRG